MTIEGILVNNKQNINQLPLWIGLCGLGFLIIGLMINPTLLTGLGIVLGCVLASANIFFLTKIITKMLSAGEKNSGFLIFLIVLKLIFIAGMLLFAIKVLKINLLYFALGYLSFVPGVFIYQLRTKS